MNTEVGIREHVCSCEESEYTRSFVAVFVLFYSFLFIFGGMQRNLELLTGKEAGDLTGHLKGTLVGSRAQINVGLQNPDQEVSKRSEDSNKTLDRGHSCDSLFVRLLQCFLSAT